MSELFIVYRENDTDSELLADYYLQKYDLDGSNKIGVPCSLTEILPSYEDFQSEVENTIKSAIDADTSVIILGMNVPGGFHDGGDIISSTSRISRINHTFSKKMLNPLFDRKEMYEYDDQALDLALICSRIDGPNLESAKAIIDNGENLKNQIYMNGAFVLDPYAAVTNSKEEQYREDLLYAANNSIPRTNVKLISTILVDPYLDPVIPYLQSDSIYWGWFQDRSTDSFFRNTDTQRIFFYNADFDGAFSVRDLDSEMWCRLALNGGYATCAGAMSNPTTEGYLRPTPFVESLIKGFSIGEAYIFSSLYLDWTIALFGDPLNTTSFRYAVPRTASPSTDTVYTEPVPNAIAWPGRMYASDHDKLKAVWEEYLGFGFNTLPLGNPNFLTGPLVYPSDDATIDNILKVQEELGGIPIQMEYSFGYTYNWISSGGPLIYRDGNTGHIERDPGDPAHYPNYHTNVEAAFLAGGSMEAVIDANVGVPASGNYASSVSYLHCPNSTVTSAFVNALAQFDEYCKWLKPQAVWIDTEKYQSANYVDPIIKTAINSSVGLNGCSRCGSFAGYQDGTNAVYAAICRTIRKYNPTAAILSYTSVYDNVTTRFDQRFGELGRDKSEMIIGSPYPEKLQQDFGVAPRKLYTTDLGARVLYLRDIDPTLPGNLRSWQATQAVAINGSYFQITNYMDISDTSRGFMSPETMYDLCYFLASEGAYGFSIYPGYLSKDKDPETFPPNTPAYTSFEIAQDEAGKLLYTAGIKAFRDYSINSLHKIRPLPVF